MKKILTEEQLRKLINAHEQVLGTDNYTQYQMCLEYKCLINGKWTPWKFVCWTIPHRTVLLVDDVYDSGNTMDWLRDRFKNTGAKEVLSCVLIDKLPGHPNKKSNIDFIGHIMTEKKFLVGYGMDDNKLYRNTNEVLIKL